MKIIYGKGVSDGIGIGPVYFYCRAFGMVPHNTVQDTAAEWKRFERAKNKADWYDPTVAKEDEFFGKCKHEKDAESKKLKYDGYWW